MARENKPRNVLAGIPGPVQLAGIWGREGGARVSDLDGVDLNGVGGLRV
jgi:hypothetical protein